LDYEHLFIVIISIVLLKCIIIIFLCYYLVSKGNAVQNMKSSDIMSRADLIGYKNSVCSSLFQRKVNIEFLLATTEYLFIIP